MSVPGSQSLDIRETPVLYTVLGGSENTSPRTYPIRICMTDLVSSLGDASWDDLKVLLAIAHTGSLSRAATELGLTQPTVGRRMDRLEEAVGVPLVRRTSLGCDLSPRGRTLLPLIQRMREAADGISRLANSAHNDLDGVVRIATGDLPARFLARRLPELLVGAPRLRLEVITGKGFVNLERGEADLALRNTAPAGDAWTVLSLGRVEYAVYAAPNFVERYPAALEPAERQRLPWIGFDNATSVHSARWLRSYLGRDPELAFSNSLVVLEAAACGGGLAVLPLYIGDDEPRLRRLSPPVEGLGFEGLLVIHPSAHRLKRVRWVASRLRQLFDLTKV